MKDILWQLITQNYNLIKNSCPVSPAVISTVPEAAYKFGFLTIQRLLSSIPVDLLSGGAEKVLACSKRA